VQPVYDEFQFAINYLYPLQLLIVSTPRYNCWCLYVCWENGYVHLCL